MGREEHCKQISLVCGGSARSVWATQGLPPLTACVLSWSTLLRLPGCSAGELSKVGLGCMHIPGLSHSRSRFSGTPQRCILRWACVLCPSQVRAAQVTRYLASALSPGTVRLIASPVPAAQFPGCSAVTLPQVCLFWAADLWLQPSWRISTTRTWLATGSLLTVW